MTFQFTIYGRLKGADAVSSRHAFLEVRDVVSSVDSAIEDIRTSYELGCSVLRITPYSGIQPTIGLHTGDYLQDADSGDEDRSPVRGW